MPGEKADGWRSGWVRKRVLEPICCWDVVAPLELKSIQSFVKTGCDVEHEHQQRGLSDLPCPFILPSSSSFLYIWNQGCSYLIYWQLGAWFQIYRDLEDEGFNPIFAYQKYPSSISVSLDGGKQLGDPLLWGTWIWGTKFNKISWACGEIAIFCAVLLSVETRKIWHQREFQTPFMYPSSHNHGSGKMGPSNIGFLLFRVTLQTSMIMGERVVDSSISCATKAFSSESASLWCPALGLDHVAEALHDSLPCVLAGKL